VRPRRQLPSGRWMIETASVLFIKARCAVALCDLASAAIAAEPRFSFNVLDVGSRVAFHV
jgi:hypothetical protein